MPTLSHPLRAALCAIPLLLGACSPLPLINGLVPSKTYQATRDIAYGAGPRRQLDVYVPAGLAPDAKAPVVLFFYGGNWDAGSRGDYLFAGEAFASQGMVAVVADYRVYPEVKYPAFLEDSAAAFAWARNNIARFGGDPQRIYVAGHSAGAYNAAMLAFDPEYLTAAGVAPGASGRAVRGFIGLAGPYDFLPLHSAKLEAIFGGPDTSPLTQPITHVGHGNPLPPSLLLVGQKDRTVDPGNSVRLALKLGAAGAQVEEKFYPDLDHARLLGALAAPLRSHFGPVLQDITAFIRRDGGVSGQTKPAGIAK
ncbi:MAG: esterase/lipase/thioesterase family protein [Betaproteobacteria bacterium]|nr:esterase/lipase/thioesterase family protein [Betaproteobacteria bacterium]